MPQETIDLRSDTVTVPSLGMRAAIAEAPLGDDVIDTDPTIAALEEFAANLLGKEASIFMPSGTMTNQIALRVHCLPGDEFLCEENCHIFNYEQGAFAQLSGLVGRTVRGEYGVLSLAQLEGRIRPENDHLTRTRLLCLENTHNRGGGRVLPYEGLTEMCGWAHENGLATHLDGARLMNAVVATEIPAAQWCQHFDTVSLCLSKGLGAPVGSILAGTQEKITLARRHRKLFGGGMRQAGVIAAGGLYALQHNIERLAEDHQNALVLANAVRAAEGLRLEPPRVDTNMVLFRVAQWLATAPDFAASLESHGVRCLAICPEQIRLVTHLDVSREQVERAGEIIVTLAEKISQGEVKAATGGELY